MKIRHVDHIGINVESLEAGKNFFTDLGFIVIGETVMRGELVDRVTGLKNVKDNLVMLQAPDGQLFVRIAVIFEANLWLKNSLPSWTM